MIAQTECEFSIGEGIQKCYQNPLGRVQCAVCKIGQSAKQCNGECAKRGVWSVHLQKGECFLLRSGQALSPFLSPKVHNFAQLWIIGGDWQTPCDQIISSSIPHKPRCLQNSAENWESHVSTVMEIGKPLWGGWQLCGYPPLLREDQMRGVTPHPHPTPRSDWMKYVYAFV